MSRRTSLRPCLESLDSLLLLSTVVPGGEGTHPAPHSAPALVHAEAHSVPVTTVDLHGTIRAPGTFTTKEVTLAGSGNLGAVGVASIRTKINLQEPSQLLVLSTHHGKIDVGSTTGLLVGTGTAVESYTVVGGTGSYAHATGSGTVSVTFESMHANRIVVDVNFS